MPAEPPQAHVQEMCMNEGELLQGLGNLCRTATGGLFEYSQCLLHIISHKLMNLSAI